MPSCPRCLAITDGGSSYCGVCGRPRIVESLRAPVAPHPWTIRAWRGVIALFFIWLIVTTGVAILREARAVRLSRTLLAENKTQDAWAVLHPFVLEHPRHEQAAFLCGKATIRLELAPDAKRCLDQVEESSPELAKELKADYLQVLTERSRALGCNATGFEQLLAWEGHLGSAFTTGVIAGLDGVIESCHNSSEGSQELARLAALLNERGQATAMIEKGYVPAIRRAMTTARYGDVRGLAQEAVSTVPEGSEAIDALLVGERRKVAATEKTLRQLCTTLKGDPQYQNGWSTCFPATAPAVVLSARDGWGNALAYSAIGSYSFGEQQCNQGVVLTSYGSDGTQTEGEQGSPAAEMSCRVPWDYWQLPHEFWLSEVR